MRINTPNRFTEKTHEGAPAVRNTAEQELRRAVMTCMLWEDQFYESGVSIADRIKALIPKVDATTVMNIAIEARTLMKLRHVPLLIAREMLRYPEHRSLVAHTLEQVVQRADELTEFCAIYWGSGDRRENKGGKMLPRQAKKGLGAAFARFTEYDLAKYNRDNAVKLKDVLFMAHIKPTVGQLDKAVMASPIVTPNYARGTVARHLGALTTKLVEDTLETPDTWEVELSKGGDDKKASWERLLKEKKLGALALLRNLRNMEQAGVSKATVAAALAEIKTERVLPFRFIAAARALPAWEDIIEPGMLRCLEGREKLPGRTKLLLDVSGSMDGGISGKSDLRRVDAACGLAILLREMCDDVEVYTFSNNIVQIPPRRGFALRDAIINSQQHAGTQLGQSVTFLNDKGEHDRIMVISDEQSNDPVPQPKGRGYMINVAAYKNGVAHGAWERVDGWSEAIIDYIRVLEGETEAEVGAVEM